MQIIGSEFRQETLKEYGTSPDGLTVLGF